MARIDTGTLPDWCLQVGKQHSPARAEGQTVECTIA